MGFLGHLISKAVIQVTRHQQKYWVGFIYCYFCLFIRFANHLIAKKQQQKFFHYKLSLFWRIRIVNCRPISFSFFFHKSSIWAHQQSAQPELFRSSFNAGKANQFQWIVENSAISNDSSFHLHHFPNGNSIAREPPMLFFWSTLNLF